MTRSEDFYLRFEARFRGSVSSIKQRLEAYLPVLDLLGRDGDGFEALDLGSGRGEWLELLSERGWRVYGVDSNSAMAGECRSRGLEVEQGDALAHLRGLPENSLWLISGFHIVEHLPFELLQELLAQALRVLRPGGVVIFETPNPENLLVGAHTFYLDPTHQRPIPPALLSFLAEDCGYESYDIVRLHPRDELAAAFVDSEPEGVKSYARQAYGPQDYALVAAKRTAQQTKPSDLETLQRLLEKIDYESQSEPLSIAHRLNQAESRLNSIERSASWRFTAPLRALYALGRALAVSLVIRPLRWAQSFSFRNCFSTISFRVILGSSYSFLRSIPRLRQMLQASYFYVCARPRLKSILLGVLNRFPETKHRLIRMQVSPVDPPVSNDDTSSELKALSPQARRIYNDLLAEIKRVREQAV